MCCVIHLSRHYICVHVPLYDSLARLLWYKPLDFLSILAPSSGMSPCVPLGADAADVRALILISKPGRELECIHRSGYIKASLIWFPLAELTDILKHQLMGDGGFLGVMLFFSTGDWEHHKNGITTLSCLSFLSTVALLRTVRGIGTHKWHHVPHISKLSSVKRVGACHRISAALKLWL